MTDEPITLETLEAWLHRVPADQLFTHEERMIAWAAGEVKRLQTERDRYRVQEAQQRAQRAIAENAMRAAQAERDALIPALQLITVWTTPGLVAHETVRAAHEKAREALGLSLE